MNCVDKESSMRDKFSDIEDLIAFLRDRPELGIYGSPYLAIYHRCDNPEEFSRLARLLGAATKTPDDDDLELTKTFGESKIVLYISHEIICEKRIVGKRVVPSRPATEAVEEHEEDVVEWVCPPSILALTEQREEA